MECQKISEFLANMETAVTEETLLIKKNSVIPGMMTTGFFKKVKRVKKVLKMMTISQNVNMELPAIVKTHNTKETSSTHSHHVWTHQRIHHKRRKPGDQVCNDY
jgi:short-subunit dehydrogenase